MQGYPADQEADFVFRQTAVVGVGDNNVKQLVAGDPNRIYVGFLPAASAPGTSTPISTKQAVTAQTGFTMGAGGREFRYKWEGALCAQAFYFQDTAVATIIVLEVIYRPKGKTYDPTRSD